MKQSTHKTWMKRLKPLLLLEILAVVVILSMLLWFTFPLFLQNQNFNNARNFPDPNFRRAVEKFMGVEEDGRFTKEDVEKIEGTLNCSGQHIRDLTGIEHFKSILGLACSSNNLEQLDLSQLPQLQDLYLDYNRLTQIDVSQNSELVFLSIQSNQLVTIDTSKNLKLRLLDCTSNKLSKLDVSKNTQLEVLALNNNQINTLDLSKNTKLKYLGISNNTFTTLDPSSLKDLTFLECDDNRLTELDLTNNPMLESLGCASNKLKRLNLSNNSKLTSLQCNQNELQFLELPDLHFLISVKILDFSNNLFDCEDWNDLQTIIKSVKEKSPNCSINYSPQKGLDPYECAEIEP